MMEDFISPKLEGQRFEGHSVPLDLLQDEGVATFDLAGKLSSFETVEHVTLTDPLDIDRRVAELSLLKDGWLDGQGSALDPDGLRRAGTQFRTCLDPKIPPPFLYPTPEGELRAEWSLATAEVSLDINLASLVGQYSALDVATGESIEQTLDLTQDESWATLNQDLGRLVRTVSRDSAND